MMHHAHQPLLFIFHVSFSHTTTPLSPPGFDQTQFCALQNITWSTSDETMIMSPFKTGHQIITIIVCSNARDVHIH